MLESPVDAPVKRYAPPNQRNRCPGRRKSSDKSERTSNFHLTDGDKSLGPGFRSAPSMDGSDTGSNKSGHEIFHPRLIALTGCCTSDASQLLQERWETAVHSYNDPTVDLSERPVMCSGSAESAWGTFRLPHQLMAAPQMDFLVELQRAIHNSNMVFKN